MPQPDARSFTLDAPDAGPARVLRCALLDHPALIHGFATRQGLAGEPAGTEAGTEAGTGAGARRVDLDFGPQPTAAGRAPGVPRLAARLNFAPPCLFTVKQAHGDRVVHVGDDSRPEQMRGVEADALVTATPGLVLGVRTADCVPVLLADLRRGAVAAAHAGWRGLIAGVLQRTVEALVRLGCVPDSLIAAVGPAIGPDAFEVGPEVAKQFADADLGAEVVRWPAAGGRPHLHLKLAAARVLRRAGVGQIALSDACTHASPALFHSFRRDGVAAGRLLSVVGIAQDG